MKNFSHLLKHSPVLVLLLSVCAATAQSANSARTAYCVRSQGTNWSRQDFQPLINVNAGQTIVRLTYDNDAPRSLKIRQFTPDYELTFEYEAGRDGRFVPVYGAVIRRSQWIYETSRFRQTEAGIAPAQAQYARIAGGLAIAEPAGAGRFTSHLAQVPAFNTVADLPCTLTPARNSVRTQQIGQ